MPLVVVTHGPAVPEECLLRLSQSLPHLVSVAVECPEEPYDGALRPGDVETGQVRPAPRGARRGRRHR